MLRLYSWLAFWAAPWAFLLVLWRGCSDRSYWQGLGERFGFGKDLHGARIDRARIDGAQLHGTQTVWIHAVSLGEMTAAAPMILALSAPHRQLRLVVTTATPAGRARAQSAFRGADIRYLPYDTRRATARFLDRVRPQAAILMETELWPNLFEQCARRKIPILLASARLSDRSVRRYRYARTLLRRMLGGNVLIAAQSAADAQRFAAIGASAAQIRICGNLKFDLATDPTLVQGGRKVRSALGAARPVWIAGSTHEGEEEQVLAAHVRLLAQHADALLLLAPRHKARFDSVSKLLAREGLRFARRSDPQGSYEQCQVLLVDTLGELAMLYAAADVAFVGGSLVPVGGHNLLEPAALGVPVLTGPFNANGRDIAALLLRAGAAEQVADAAQLAEALLRWIGQPDLRQRAAAAASEILAAHRGSLNCLLELIEPLLAAAAAHP